MVSMRWMPAWTNSSMESERQSIGGMDTARTRGPRRPSLEQLAKAQVGERDGRIADEPLRDAVAAFEIEAHAMTSTMRRAGDEARSGGDVGTASSIFKFLATENNKRRQELRLEILGLSGLGWEGDGFDPEHLQTTRDWLRSKANSIEGGSSEIPRYMCVT